MGKIIDDLRHADPELWREIKVICVQRDRTLYKWILDWLRFAVHAEKTLGPDVLPTLQNKLSSKNKKEVALSQQKLV